MSILKLFVLAIAGLLCLAGLASGQATAADRALLSTFEQRVEQGRYSDVEGGLLQFVLSHPEIAAGYELLGRLRFRQERLKEASSLYRRAVTLDPKLLRARIDLAVTVYRMGESATALEMLKSIGINATISTNDGLRLVEALVLVREFEMALRAADLLPPKVKNGQALPFRAESYVALNQRDNVLRVLSTAKAIAQREPEVAIDVAGSLVGTAFNKPAAELLLLVLSTDTKNVRAMIFLGRAKIYDRDLDAARTYVARAAANSPGSPEAAFLLAVIESEQGRTAEALAAFEHALRLSPGSVEVMSKAVVAAMRANQSRRAVEIARELITRKPDDPDFIYLFGAASLHAGRVTDAETYLERYSRERPNDSRGCVAFALSLAAQPAKIAAARSKLEGCVAMDPTNFEATYQLGLSHRSSGDTAKAIDYLERTVDRSPNYASAVRDLGVLYLQTGNELRARSILEKAVKLAPDDADTHFQLSRLYNLAGEPALAKQHFDKFQKLKNPNGN